MEESDKFDIVNGDPITIETNKLDNDKVDEYKGKFFIEDTKVPDVLRYTYTKDKLLENDKSDLQCSHFKDIKAGKYDKSIVLILESPHIDEYTGEFKPIAPAQGKTGRNIKKNLKNVIDFILNKIKLEPENTFSINDDTPIIICNPIQWQTSMAYLYKDSIKKLEKDLRNKVWKKIWNSEIDNSHPIQDNFKNRLENYKPILIINACTDHKEKGKKIKSLKQIIQDFWGDEKFSNIKIVQVNHPADTSWAAIPFGIKT